MLVSSLVTHMYGADQVLQAEQIVLDLQWLYMHSMDIHFHIMQQHSQDMA